VDFENKNPWWRYWDCEFDIIDNPDPGGINTSARVGYILTTDAGAMWEGGTVAERYAPFDFAAGTYFSLKIYAPEEGRPVGFKIETFLNYGDKAIEIQGTTTKSFEWEEMEFDFAGLDPQNPGEDPAEDFYDRFVIFPDFYNGNIDEDWYIDDIYFHGTPAGTKEDIRPVGYQLYAQNYPNPFNPNTTISYVIPTHSQVKLAVYDMLGKEITVLVNDAKMAGTYTAAFDGSNHSSGMYFYTLTAGREILTGKMLLIK